MHARSAVSILPFGRGACEGVVVTQDDEGDIWIRVVSDAGTATPLRIQYLMHGRSACLSLISIHI